jgi:hypothetical protein
MQPTKITTDHFHQPLTAVLATATITAGQHPRKQGTVTTPRPIKRALKPP